MYFRDRSQAGKELAKALAKYAGNEDAVVLALPRGGVPVAFEVAKALQLPLDVLLVRKLGVPGQEEFAMGAIAEGGVMYINEHTKRELGIPESTVDRIVETQKRELERRRRLYKGDRPLPSLDGKIVILIDDGLATGATMRAAANALSQLKLKRLVVAVPVGASDTCQDLETMVDELVCLHTPSPFRGVGLWYRDFSQTSDEDVRRLLDQAASRENPAE